MIRPDTYRSTMDHIPNWVKAPAEAHKPRSPRHPRYYDHKPHRTVVHDSLYEGTFTTIGDSIYPSYGINRKERRRIARILGMDWVPFNLLLLKDPDKLAQLWLDAGMKGTS